MNFPYGFDLGRGATSVAPAFIKGLLKNLYLKFHFITVNF